MANIAKLATGVRPAGIQPDADQLALPADEAIEAGDVVRIEPTSRRFTKGNTTAAAEARIFGVAASTVVAGQAVTAIRRGKMAGFDLSGATAGADVHLSRTDGGLDDATDATAGAVNVVVGKAIPVAGTSGDKILLVEVRN
jgi:hypothetical protein